MRRRKTKKRRSNNNNDKHTPWKNDKQEEGKQK